MKFFRLKTTLLSLFLIVSVSLMQSQENAEYKAEIGANIGVNFYTGDANTIARKGLFLNNLRNEQPDVGILFRYKFNKRTSIRLNYDYTQVKGNYEYYYSNQIQNITLNNGAINIYDLSGEYNFFEFDNNKYKKFSKTYTPFVFAGIGYVQMPNSTEQTKSSVTIPFGFGIKAKINNRLNFNLMWTNHLLLRDNLEGLEQYTNPLPMTVSNLMNNDLLTGINVGLSFDFWMRDCNCNSASNKTYKKIMNKKPLNNSRPRK